MKQNYEEEWMWWNGGGVQREKEGWEVVLYLNELRNGAIEK